MISNVEEEVINTLKPKFTIAPVAEVGVAEDFERELIEIDSGDAVMVLTVRAASNLTMRLHRAIAKIRKSHNHPKNRVPKDEAIQGARP